MTRAFRVRYTFAVAVELSDDERNELVEEAIGEAEKQDVGDDDTFVFEIVMKGKSWYAYVDIGRAAVHVMTPEEAAAAKLPTKSNPWGRPT